MSRVLHIEASEAEVATLCETLHVAISVSEPLLSGGTRIVLKSEEGTAILERAARKKLILTPVRRSPLYLTRTTAYR